jgi:hypothetical protein
MNTRHFRLLVSCIALFTASLFAQEEEGPALLGTVDEETNTYTAPGGHYRVAIPVLPELGGTIEDSPIVTDFRDAYGTHILIANVPLDAAMRAELEKSDRKEFLTRFYAQQGLADYQRTYPGSKLEAARYLPKLNDGTLFATVLVPGGSIFRELLFLKEGETEPVSKRGSLLFIHNNRVFMITVDLYERMLKRDTFKKTPEEEDAILRDRLIDFLRKMNFPTLATNPPASATAPAPTPAAPATPAAK